MIGGMLKGKGSGPLPPLLGQYTNRFEHLGLSSAGLPGFELAQS